jgi:hypothetical protein
MDIFGKLSFARHDQRTFERFKIIPLSLGLSSFWCTHFCSSLVRYLTYFMFLPRVLNWAILKSTHRIGRGVAIAGVVLITTQPGLAQAQLFDGPSTTAMAGAGRAALDSVEAPLLNPATLTQNRRSLFSIGYGRLSDMLTTSGFTGFSVTMIDGDPDKLFPGAFSYSQGDRQLVAGQTALLREGSFSIGKPISRIFNIGAGIKYTKIEGPSGLGIDRSYWNANLGLLAVLSGGVGVALVGTDLLGSAADLPVALRPIPKYSAGVHWAAHPLANLRLDVVSPRNENPENLTDVRLGFDSKVKNFVAIRFGYAWVETRKAQEATAGFSIIGPRLSFSYGWAQVQKSYLGASLDGQRHVFDLWLPL